MHLYLGLLDKTTQIMVDYMVEDAGNGTMSTSYNATKSGTGPDLLKPLTKPFTNLIVQVDKDVLIGWSFNVSSDFFTFFHS